VLDRHSVVEFRDRLDELVARLGRTRSVLSVGARDGAAGGEDEYAFGHVELQDESHHNACGSNERRSGLREGHPILGTPPTMPHMQSKAYDAVVSWIGIAGLSAGLRAA